MTEVTKTCPFCGIWGSDMGAHSDKCYLRMIQESLTVGMHSPDTEEIIGTWIEAWNTRHIPEGYALVPIYPTEEATLAGSLAGRVSAHTAGKIFKAMIEAAQESPK